MSGFFPYTPKSQTNLSGDRGLSSSLSRSPSFTLHRIATAVDAGDVTSRLFGMNTFGFEDVIVRVSPGATSDVSAEVKFWSSTGGKFVSAGPELEFAGHGTGVPFEFRFAALGRVVYIALTGTIGGGENVKVLIAGALRAARVKGAGSDVLLSFDDLIVQASDGGYFLDPVTPQVIGGFGANVIPQGVISGRNYASIFASYLVGPPYTQQIDQWISYDTVITANQITAPDGTNTVDKVKEGGTGAGNPKVHGLVDTALKFGIVCVWVKDIDMGYVQLRLQHVNHKKEWGAAVYNLGNGTVEETAEGSAPILPEVLAAYAVAAGGGYFLFLTVNLKAFRDTDLFVDLCDSASPSRDVYGNIMLTMANRSIYVWQGQTTKTPVCSGPLVLTEATAVTRAPDVVYWPSGGVPVAILSGRYAIGLVNFWVHTEPVGDMYLLAIDANNYLKWNNTTKTFELYAGGVKKMDSNALTLSRYQSSLVLTCNLITGDMTVAGADSGNGTNSGTSCSWSTGNLYFGCDHASSNQFDGLLSEPYTP